MKTSWRWTPACVLAGVVVGGLYTIAPIGLLSVAGMALLVAFAGRRLPPDERRLLQVLLVTALVARVVVIAALAVAGTIRHADPSVGLVLSGDETYALTRSLRTRDIAVGMPVTKYDYMVVFEEYGRTPYVALLSALQLWFGPSPYGPRLLNTLLFVSAATLLFGTVRRVYGPRPALVGLLLTVWYPALFVWSVSALKESLYLLGGVLVLTGTIDMLSAAASRDRFRAGLAVVVGMAIVVRMRPGAFALVAGGLACGLLLREATRSRVSAAVALAIGVAGAAGFASSAQLQARGLAALGSMAKAQTGHVFTTGHAYKTLDESFYVNPAAPAASTLTLDAGQSARYVVRSVVSFIVVPVPWQFVSARELAYLPDHLLWNLMVVLSPVGFVAAWRRDPLVACLLVGYVAPIALAVALTNGNIGTLVRLRGAVVPYLSQLFALGMLTVLQWLAATTSTTSRWRSGARVLR